MGQPAGPIGKAGWIGQAAVWTSVGLDVIQPVLGGSDRIPSVDDPVARKPSGQHRLQETAALPTRVEVLAELSRTRGGSRGRLQERLEPG